MCFAWGLPVPWIAPEFHTKVSGGIRPLGLEQEAAIKVHLCGPTGRESSAQKQGMLGDIVARIGCT